MVRTSSRRYFAFRGHGRWWASLSRSNDPISAPRRTQPELGRCDDYARCPGSLRGAVYEQLAPVHQPDLLGRAGSTLLTACNYDPAREMIGRIGNGIADRPAMASAWTLIEDLDRLRHLERLQQTMIRWRRREIRLQLRLGQQPRQHTTKIRTAEKRTRPTASPGGETPATAAPSRPGVEKRHLRDPWILRRSPVGGSTAGSRARRRMYSTFPWVLAAGPARRDARDRRRLAAALEAGEVERARATTASRSRLPASSAEGRVVHDVDGALT